ncbi:MAG TPA: hypothetical protein EYN95_09010 [Methylococcaceae bacterium]|nr:hypothetical protein [Methylococcaceae bacterium]
MNFSHTKIPFPPIATELFPDVTLIKTDKFIFIQLENQGQLLGTNILNGGLSTIDSLVNLNVVTHAFTADQMTTPLTILTNWQQQNQHLVKANQTMADFLTAASMNSLSIVKRQLHNEYVAVITTAGFSNARAAGDRAEYRNIESVVEKIGTINTIILTSAKLSDAAKLEALIIATEAKVTVIYELKIKSQVSNAMATGTGTDACALVSNLGGKATVAYSGKHTLLGETIGKLVTLGLRESSAYKTLI